VSLPIPSLPNHTDTLTSSASIVAVHGLNGDSKNTWTNSRTNAFWLKDFLPHDVPDARILTFGYNAGAAFGNTTADIIDHAKSLLSSLVDKREEDDVGCRYSLETLRLRYYLGADKTYYIYRAFARRNSG
jgi:hypothetical protein